MHTYVKRWRKRAFTLFRHEFVGPWRPVVRTVGTQVTAMWQVCILYTKCKLAGHLLRSKSETTVTEKGVTLGGVSVSRSPKMCGPHARDL